MSSHKSLALIKYWFESYKKGITVDTNVKGRPETGSDHYLFIAEL